MDADKALQQEAGWLARSMPDQMEARARVISFVPKIGNKYQCPHCWLRKGMRVPLTAIESSTDDHDLLRCDGCRGEFVVPL
jgi:hypothetical protein